MYISEEQIKNLSIDQLVDLYRQGYTIRENVYPPIDDILPYSSRYKYRFMSMNNNIDIGAGSLIVMIAGLGLFSFVYYNIGKAETEWISKYFKK